MPAGLGTMALALIGLFNIAGSWGCAWLGGWVFEATGSYSLIWAATAVAGLVAAMLHFPIDDAPRGRAAPAEVA
jgi:predicted MFS family arabinose efflux permease